MSGTDAAALPHGGAARWVPLVAWLACLALGVALIVGAMMLPASRTADVGPGRIPLLVGSAVAILAVICLVREILGRGQAPDIGQGGTAAILLALLVGYCALIGFVGVIASTVIFMMAIMLWLDGPRHWLRSALITAVFSALIYALFTWVISTPLP